MTIAVAETTTTMTVTVISRCNAAAAIVNKCCVNLVATTIAVAYLRISTSIKREDGQIGPLVIAGNMD